MKRPATSNPKAQLNDTDEMRAAIEALNAEGVRFSRPTQYQLKIGDLSFYPGTERIFRDGEDKAWEQQGLSALICHLREKRKPTAKVIDFAPADNTLPPPGIDLSAIARADATIPVRGPSQNFGNQVSRLVPPTRRPN